MLTDAILLAKLARTFGYTLLKKEQNLHFKQIYHKQKGSKSKIGPTRKTNHEKNCVRVIILI